MESKGLKYGPQAGCFTGKTSPGPKGSNHGISEKLPSKMGGGGSNPSFSGGPNDGTIVKTASGKPYKKG